ncbi:MAG: Hsp70 family protein, partial [Deltaproteobacteria bacterium]|nr:Hsp70 family protein [Deltaproteobacteria bacterium]
MGKTAGIDLGTTNSLIAFVNSDGRPEVIPVDGEKRLLKSVAAFTDEGALVGSSARELSVKIPDRVVYSVKRLMGKGIRDLKGEDDKLAYRLVQDTDGIIRIDLGDRTITPPEVSALILKELKRKAENFLGETVERAVIN